MNALPSNIVLSEQIRRIGENLTVANPDELPDLGLVLVKLADLSKFMELELQILREMETGRELRAGLNQVVGMQLSRLASTDDKVVIADFDRRKP